MDRLVSTIGIEPITLAEAKLQLRETGTDQDALINTLIASCRRYAENITKRAFCTQTRELNLPGFPANSIIKVPRPPLQSIVSITYIDQSGTVQTVDAANYQVDTVSEPGRVKPAYLKYWPFVRTSDFNAVKVTYICGYSPVGSPSDYAAGMPESLKTWMKMRVNTLFENRGSVEVDQRLNQVIIPPDLADGQLDELRVDVFN